MSDKHTHELGPGDVVEVEKRSTTDPGGRVVRFRFAGYRPKRGVLVEVASTLRSGDQMAVEFTDGSVAYAPAEHCAWYVREEASR